MKKAWPVLPWFWFVFLLAGGSPEPAALARGGSAADPRTGLSLSVSEDGSYRVSWGDPDWQFSGRMDGPISPPTERRSRDGAGDFIEIAWRDASGAGGSYAVRLYPERQSFLFLQRTSAAGATRPRFPDFAAYPQLPHSLSYARDQFSPVRFSAQGDAPWIFYDDLARSFLLSPANHFMVANDFAENGHLAAGLEPGLVDQNGEEEFAAVLTLGRGVNATFENWGLLLTGLSGKTRLSSSGDSLLSRLSYWTDNTAAYYYNFDSSLGYADTLSAVEREFAGAGVPLGSVQLDSWWYEKGGDPARSLPPSWKASNNYRHGIYRFEMPEDLMPGGLPAFQARLALPLTVHSRWIDATSPYRGRYSFSRNVPTDEKYWRETMARLRAADVEVFEQDWLNDFALPDLTRLRDADLFLDAMAGAAAAEGIHLQYCMPLPRHFLQASKYANAVTVRPSPDGFARKNWRNFLFGARLARSVGLWPFTDVFYSRDERNLLIAALSGGPVGVGDRLASNANERDIDPRWCAAQHCAVANFAHLRRTVQRDGLLVKPDRGLIPLDQSYLHPDRVVSAAFSDDSSGYPLAAYVFAFAEAAGAPELRVGARELGFSGPIYVHDYFSGQGRVVGRGEEFAGAFDLGGRYWIAAPIQANGVALLGDLGFYASLGRSRIVARDASHFRLLRAGQEESAQVWLYAASRPNFRVKGGTLRSLAREPGSGLWKATLYFGEARVVDVEL